MYGLYNFALALAALVAWPWLLASKKRRAGLRERFGRVPSRLEGIRECIWIHAVSVGEVLAVSGLVAELRREFPRERIVISTTTATGRKLARERFGEESVFYFPLDFGFAVRRYVAALRPRLVILAETEFWPNFLRMVKQSGAKIAVVNARISDRSLGGYRCWRGWMRRVLANIDLFLAQSEEDARRLVEIGAAAERVQVAGNLKFDIGPPVDSPLLSKLRSAIGRDVATPVIVAGSTMGSEHDNLLNAFGAVLRSYPRAMLLLAPRRPEDFENVAWRGGAVPCIRRSHWHDEGLNGSLFLLDTIGELAPLYALADLAFVGGSLVNHGGHNILEPAYFGKAIMVGPHTQNFREVVEAFVTAEAITITDIEPLARDLLHLMQNPETRKRLGERAENLMRTSTGATARTLAAVKTLMSSPAREPEFAHAEPSR